MSAGQRDITTVIADILAALPEVKPCRLHVSEPVLRYLETRQPAKPRPAWQGLPLTGIPVVIDDDLSGGQWQIREDGEVVKSGDMAPAPDGMTAVYSSTFGWLAVKTDPTDWWAAS